MPTYAQRADCLAYTEGLVVTDNAWFDRLIERAERDVDRWHTLTTRLAGAGGLRVPDVTKVTVRQREGLRDATCAQVEYRLEAGEAEFRGHQPKRVAGPDFTVEHDGATDRSIGPKVRHELHRAGILRTTAVAV